MLLVTIGRIALVLLSFYFFIQYVNYGSGQTGAEENNDVKNAQLYRIKKQKAKWGSWACWFMVILSVFVEFSFK